jgi:hypothetical protein
MRINYSDYDGPQGGCAVIDGKIVELDNAAISALAQNAMILATGNVGASADAPADSVVA